MRHTEIPVLSSVVCTEVRVLRQKAQVQQKIVSQGQTLTLCLEEAVMITVCEFLDFNLASSE